MDLAKKNNKPYEDAADEHKKLSMHTHSFQIYLDHMMGKPNALKPLSCFVKTFA